MPACRDGPAVPTSSSITRRWVPPPAMPCPAASPRSAWPRRRASRPRLSAVTTRPWPTCTCWRSGAWRSTTARWTRRIDMAPWCATRQRRPVLAAPMADLGPPLLQRSGQMRGQQAGRSCPAPPPRPPSPSTRGGRPTSCACRWAWLLQRLAPCFCAGAPRAPACISAAGHQDTLAGLASTDRACSAGVAFLVRASRKQLSLAMLPCALLNCGCHPAPLPHADDLDWCEANVAVRHSQRAQAAFAAELAADQASRLSRMRAAVPLEPAHSRPTP